VADLSIPLQPNSNSLQSNSDTTASEFQQLQLLGLTEFTCSRRETEVDGGKRRDFRGSNRIEMPRISTDLCGIDLQCLAVRRPQPIAKPSVDFPPVTDKVAEGVIQGPLATNHLSTNGFHWGKAQNSGTHSAAKNGRDRAVHTRVFLIFPLRRVPNVLD
jgi:hypothetical protein